MMHCQAAYPTMKNEPQRCDSSGGKVDEISTTGQGISPVWDIYPSIRATLYSHLFGLKNDNQRD